MTGFPGPIVAVTVFAEDLAAASEFYQRVFDLPIHHQDDDSVVFAFGATLINLLRSTEAPSLIAPAEVGPAGAIRSQFTLAVDDVDAVCARLADRGVTLLNGPVDRPWGIRTASFVDPAGQVWEIAH